MDNSWQSYEEFQNAVIKVNDIQIPYIDEIKYFKKVFDESLNTEDTANIEFQHPQLGSYNWSIVIPPPIPNLISPPDLATMNAWANGDETTPTLSLNWAAVSGFDTYSILIILYNSSHSKVGGTFRRINATSYDLDRSVLQLPDSTYAPYFTINVTPTNYVNLSDVFKDGSGIAAYSVYVDHLKNF